MIDEATVLEKLVEAPEGLTATQLAKAIKGDATTAKDQERVLRILSPLIAQSRVRSRAAKVGYTYYFNRSTFPA